MTQQRRHRLDHDLLGIEDPVDDDAETIDAHLRHHDEGFLVDGPAGRLGGIFDGPIGLGRGHFLAGILHSLFRGLYHSLRHSLRQQPRRGTAQTQDVAQLQQRQQPVAQAQHRRAVDLLDAVLRIVRGPHQFEHADLRDGEALAGALHDQRRNDGQRQRDLDREGRALAHLRLDVHRAADLLDVGPHHVHADAPARDAGHNLGRRKTRPEDETQGLLVRHILELGLRRQAVLQGLLLDPVDVDAGPVVLDLDDDVAALVIGVQHHLADLRLVRRQALRRHLQAVVGRVPHHVRQRVLDQLQHLAVELGIGAQHLQVDLLVQLVRQVTHDARQLGPGIADGLHARLHDAFLKLRGDVAQALQRHRELAVRLVARQLQQLVARQHQLADHVHQVLQHVDADPNALRRRRLLNRSLAPGGRLGFLLLARGRRCRFGRRLGIGRRQSRLGRRDLGGLGLLGRLLGRRIPRLQGLGLLEYALQFVERHLALLELAPQRLVEAPGGNLDRRRRRLGLGLGFGLGLGRRRAIERHPGRGRVKPLDQLLVVALGLGLRGLELSHDQLQPIQGLQHDGHDLAADRQYAVAHLAQDVLRRMGHAFQTRQAQKAAGPLDGVDQAENVVEDLRAVRVLLQRHQFVVDDLQRLVRLG